MTAMDRHTVSGIFANIGKVIAAYERRIVPGPSRFDRYVDAVLAADEAAADEILSDDEVTGLRLFIGRGQCVRCHNGPLFTNNDFHNTGVAGFPSMPHDEGRRAGVTVALADEFNCQGKYSDADKNDCSELRFAKTAGPELLGAMKTPTLRSAAKTGPYMHAGQHPTLDAVLNHYNLAPSAQIGTSELEPLGLTQEELTALIKFLLTLDSAPNLEPRYLSPPK
jgi:cytochrome c peroxidase